MSSHPDESSDELPARLPLGERVARLEARFDHASGVRLGHVEARLGAVETDLEHVSMTLRAQSTDLAAIKQNQEKNHNRLKRIELRIAGASGLAFALVEGVLFAIERLQ